MTQLFATDHPLTTDKDISSHDFWQQPFRQRDETFGWLRANAPVSWHKPLQRPDLPPEVHGEAGFWAVTRAEDIKRVSQDHEMFSSAIGGVMLHPRNPAVTVAPTFLVMDPPEQTRYRKIMSAAFTPRAVAKLVDKIDERAQQITRRVVGAGDIDFVSEVSAKLPMLTVADMVGVPESLVETFARAGDNFVGLRDPAIVPRGTAPIDFLIEQMAVLRGIGVDIVNHRREHPEDDIATALATAEFDGKRLTDADIGSVMLLLSVAGNDTTKQTTSWTALSLDRHRDQKAWLREDFDGRIMDAIEEFVRHASPVIESPARPPTTSSWGASRSPRATRSPSSTARATGTRACSRTRTGSISPGPVPGTSASVGAGCTSAWAAVSPRLSCGLCSARSLRTFRTWRLLPNRTTCTASSSTGSRTCRFGQAEEPMKLIVDRGRCTGNAICESIAPHAFEVDDHGGLTVLVEDVGGEDEPAIEAVRSCPAMALSFAEDLAGPVQPRRAQPRGRSTATDEGR